LYIAKKRENLDSTKNLIDVEKQYYSNRIYNRLLLQKDTFQFYLTFFYILSQRSFKSVFKQELSLNIVIKNAKIFTSIIIIKILTISKFIKQESKSN